MFIFKVDQITCKLASLLICHFQFEKATKPSALWFSKRGKHASRLNLKLSPRPFN
jgi:hypothetical protein